MREFFKIFGRAEQPKNRRIMQLSDLISIEKLDVMREIASQPSDAATYMPTLSEATRGELSAFVGRKCGTTFWVHLRSEYTLTPNVMVCVSGKRISVLPVTKSVTFAKHLGVMLKRGDKICWLENGYLCEVNWDNWKAVYRSLTTEPTSDALPVPPSRHELHMMRINRDREEMFYEAASVVRNKKLNKRGYNMTFDEVRAQMRHEAYEKRLRGVEIEARNILAVL